MRNDKFWNECTAGSIREKVVEFINKSPLLSKLKDEAYYEMEDALVDFIEENKGLIAGEVDLEYQRDDLINQATEDYGDNAALIASLIPLAKIDDVVSSWQETLADNDTYWDATWGDLSDALNEISVFCGIDDYDKDAILMYMAYLQEWYSSHDAIHEDPACIDEFFNCEMEDRETAKHYQKLADKFKKEHNL